MVKRCFNGQCVDHEEYCNCNVCKNAKNEEVSIVAEQGLYGDLAAEFGIKDGSKIQIG